MPDKEKVIKAIEYLNWYFTQDDGAADKSAVKAWEVLLREQEPAEPVKEQIFSFIFGWNCGACGFPLLVDKFMYCPRCGRKIKWDD